MSLPVSVEWHEKMINISGRIEDSLEDDDLTDIKDIQKQQRIAAGLDPNVDSDDVSVPVFRKAQRKLSCHVTISGLQSDQEYQVITSVDTTLVARGFIKRPDTSFVKERTDPDPIVRNKMRYVLLPCLPFVTNKHRPFNEDELGLGYSQLTGNELRDSILGFADINNSTKVRSPKEGAGRRHDDRQRISTGLQQTDVKALRLFIDQSVRIGQGIKEQRWIKFRTLPALPKAPCIIEPIEAIFRGPEPLLDGRIALVIQWKEGYCGGLSVESFEFYRRIGEGPWTLLIDTLEKHCTDNVTLTTLHKANNDRTTVYRAETSYQENLQDQGLAECEDEDELSRIGDKQPPLRVENISSPKNKDIFITSPQPLTPSVTIQYRLRTRSKIGYGPFSPISTILVRDKRSLEDGQANRTALITKQLAIHDLEVQIEERRKIGRSVLQYGECNSSEVAHEAIRALSIDLAEMFCTAPDRSSIQIDDDELIRVQEDDDKADESEKRFEDKEHEMKEEMYEGVNIEENENSSFASLLRQLAFVSPLSEVNRSNIIFDRDI
jgi:hypothetical protein